MEKSDHYYLRREYMRNLIVPTISTVKAELGDDLAEAFFSQCPDPLKPDMGLTPPLKGAGEDLWISPSDTLIGKVVLKPPLTNKHMKALTHEGILMIGRDVEIKFWNEAELLKQKDLRELEEILMFIAEVQKRQAVQDAHKQEWEICAREKEQMGIEFEIRLQIELKKLEQKFKREYADLMSIQKNQLEEKWQEKLEAAVAETIEKLTEKYYKDLAKQEEELLKKFSIEIKKEQIKRKLEVKATQETCQETFAHLKHQLECKNVANMMYILCMERRKCQTEREHMELEYQKQVQNVQDVLTEKEIEITKLTRDRNEKIQQIGLREECLLEILRQFQKFINFALRASPTQAEFLLSIEQMMMFELTQAIIKTHPKYGKRLANKLIPWKTDSEITSIASKKSLVVDDYHSCYNEVEPPASIHSLKSNEYLPAFHFDKHMYVREDFRNMMSQGLKISPSSLLWNKDVEHLTEILINSATNIPETKENRSQESETVDETIGEQQTLQHISMEQPRRSTVHFGEQNNEVQDKDLLFPNFDSDSNQLLNMDLYNEVVAESKKYSTSDISDSTKRECCSRCTQTLLTPLPEENILSSSTAKSKRITGVPLIGTLNSVELFKESVPFHITSLEKRLQDTNQLNTDKELLGILSAKDSLIKHRMSLKPNAKSSISQDSIGDSEIFELGNKSSPNEILQIPSEDTKKKKSFPQIPSEVKKKQSFPDEIILIPLEDKKKSSRMVDKNTTTPSKISLARDSFLVYKQSLIMKRHQSAIPQLRKLSIQPVTYKNKVSPPESTKFFPRKASSTINKLKAPYSKLSLSRDSLQLLRSQSMLSGGIHYKRHGEESKESIEIKNSILGYQKLSPVNVKLDDDGLKTVKMSHIEILPSKRKESIYGTEISKEKLHSTAHDSKNFTNTDSPWLVYQDKKFSVDIRPTLQLSRDNFLIKPNVAEIVGDRMVSEHVQKNEEFSLHRASSILGIFRKHPSLSRMFTSCTK